MRIARYAVQRRLAASAIVLALVVLGVYGLWRLPVDYLPGVTYPLIRVQIKWPGATPEEIDTSIADPVERLMSTVDRLDYLESSSLEGLYNLEINFEYGANVDIAIQDVLAALTRSQQHLPRDIEAPYVFKADPSQLPVMQLTVSSDRWTPVELRDWAENWLQDRILTVRGVAGTEVVGGLKREIRVLPSISSPWMLSSKGLPPRMCSRPADASRLDHGRSAPGPWANLLVWRIFARWSWGRMNTARFSCKTSPKWSTAMRTCA